MSDQISKSSPPWILLAIIAVDKGDRVQCQCNGCGQGIYAAIHMIALPNDEIECWGSGCYAREAGLAHVSSMKPMFPGLNGRPLTEAEREQLRVNRHKLVEQFKALHEAELQRQHEARQADAAGRAQVEACRREEDQKLQEARIASRVQRASDTEPAHSPYDLPARTCVICGQVTAEWWTNVGPTGCKCKACLKAGKS